MNFTALPLALLLLQADPASAAAQPGEADLAIRAKAVYERIKGWEGRWRGQSTKGWTDAGEFRVIAGGSVVMGTSFDAHPGETMVTMYHLDGQRLLLTHYCVAGNQPRLVATEISPDLNRVVFTYLDATGMASRDVGHMDQCVIEFDGDDRFTEQWTWYQKGRESWMEKILNQRLPATATATTGPATAAPATATPPG